MHRATRSFINPLLFSSLLVLDHSSSGAQSLSIEEVLPTIGTSFDQLNVIINIPWDTLVGNDVVWDYGWIEVDPTAADATTTIISLEEAPDVDLFPNADRVERTTLGAANDYVIDRFYDVEGGVIRELGSIGPVLNYMYDAPRLMYDFPLQYQDTVRDEYCFWSEGFGIQYHFCGNNYVTFDQVGTLVLPGGTFTNVKHVTHWRSSLETTEPATDSSYSVQQLWFVEGTPFPILDASIFIDSNGGISASARILSEAAFTSVHEQGGSQQMQIFPNPSSGLFTLRRGTMDEALISVCTMDGRLLFTERFPLGATMHQIALDQLPAATYILRSTNGTHSTTHLITKAP